MSELKYKDNQGRKVYNIDFDGTLTDGSSYNNLIPNTDMIQKVKELFFNGHIIIIWSARQWANAPIIAGWLITNNIPFHAMMLGKGGSDYYIDDKAIHSETFIASKLSEKHTLSESHTFQEENNFSEENNFPSDDGFSQ